MSKQRISFSDLKTLVLPIGFVVFTFLFGFVVVAPKAKEIFVLNRRMKEQKEELFILETKIETLSKLASINLKEKLELSLKALPAEISVPLVMSTIEQIAGQNDLDLKSFSSGDNFVFECVLEGNKSSLESFFTDLDQSLPILTTQEIKLTDVEDRLIKAEFGLKAFFLDFEEEIKASEKVSLLSSEEEATLGELEKFTFFALPALLTPVSTSASGRTNPF